jgi:ABC-2 type transport system ATP-binding protein
VYVRFPPDKSKIGEGQTRASRKRGDRLLDSIVMSAERPPAVEVVDLVKVYGAVRAVDGLSFTVDPGAVTALLGPNGAGKTTTVEICEGFRRPDAGVVRVLGHDPIRDGAALRPRVGVMLQGGGGYPGIRAGELLRLVASFAAHPLDPAALLDRLGLTAAERTAYRRLSGGQRQRLALAMAIVGRPELVFLDEPSAGLDPQARQATWEIVRELRAGGATVVLTTHDMAEAEQLADAVLIVDAGHLVAGGTPGQLTSGDDRRVRFRARPGLAAEGLAAALPTGATVAERAPGDYVVTGRVDPAVLAAVTAWCAAADVLADDLRVEHRSLEDVFLELTGRELRA